MSSVVLYLLVGVRLCFCMRLSGIGGCCLRVFGMIVYCGRWWVIL